MKQRYAFTVQYIGTKYHGMQIQEDLPTVQGEIEKALRIILREPIRIHYAGRTDTGVHAVGQVLHFDSPKELDLREFMYSMNSILPRDISFVHGQRVSEDFHARFRCIGRQYIYRVTNGPFRSAFSEGRSVWIRYPLNLEKMRVAAQYLVGEHDFAAFTREIYSKENAKTVRRIDFIDINKHGLELTFHYGGSGFLHNMIRIITGTLLHVGLDRLDHSEVPRILSGRQRKQAGQTLPAYGLYFFKASYEEYTSPEELQISF